MGMDVYGREPLNEEGMYFRASVWEWRPIMRLVRTLCADLVDEQLLSAMEYNEGAGPACPAVCKQMAARFRRWLLVFPHEEYVPEQVDARNAPETAVTQQLRTAGWSVADTWYSVSASELEHWTRFLENCQGFEVW
jgi:hypothetical protein